MQLIIGRYAGFCPGVKRAWSLAQKATKNKNYQVCILGELIHNRQAIEKLEETGIKTVDNIVDLQNKEGLVLIRAHGEPPKTYQELLKNKKLTIIDATCPSVTRVQKLAQKTEEEGYQVFVCGEADHPEAVATVGYTRWGKVISSTEEAKNVVKTDKIGVLSQTTFSPSVFGQICQILKQQCRQFKSLGTICNFVQLAQKEARQIAQKVDLVIVVGGRQSSNTKRLVEVASEIVKTHHIETASEIKYNRIKGVRKIGLLAGASTPGWIIEEVVEKIKKIDD